MSDLECTVCLERYDEDKNQPKILPCDGNHEICLACLNLVQAAARNVMYRPTYIRVDFVTQRRAGHF